MYKALLFALWITLATVCADRLPALYQEPLPESDFDYSDSFGAQSLETADQVESDSYVEKDFENPQVIYTDDFEDFDDTRVRLSEQLSHEAHGHNAKVAAGSRAASVDKKIVDPEDTFDPANIFQHDAILFNRGIADRHGKVLAMPVLELCANRLQNSMYVSSGDGGTYLASWQLLENEIYSEANKTKGFTWLQARNECRKRCMETVSMNTSTKAFTVQSVINSSDVDYIWTSGRRCDGLSCPRLEDLKPFLVNGWYWTGSGYRLPPTNEVPSGWSWQPWSQTGHEELPQPDNVEAKINNVEESCLAVLNNYYQDGIKWHDIGCDHKKPFVCEDSEELLRYIESVHDVELPRN